MVLTLPAAATPDAALAFGVRYLPFLRMFLALRHAISHGSSVEERVEYSWVEGRSDSDKSWVRDATQVQDVNIMLFEAEFGIPAVDIEMRSSPG